MFYWNMANVSFANLGCAMKDIVWEGIKKRFFGCGAGGGLLINSSASLCACARVRVWILGIWIVFFIYPYRVPSRPRKSLNTCLVRNRLKKKKVFPCPWVFSVPKLKAREKKVPLWPPNSVSLISFDLKSSHLLTACNSNTKLPRAFLWEEDNENSQKQEVWVFGPALSLTVYVCNLGPGLSPSCESKELGVVISKSPSSLTFCKNWKWILARL